MRAIHLTGKRAALRALIAGASLFALAACESDGSFDGDLRGFGRGGFDTSDAARQASAARPAPDARGVISYPGYQVAVARQGDTVESVAARVGLNAAELGNYNAIAPGTVFRAGEVLALPRRVAEGSPAAAGGTIATIGAPIGGGPSAQPSSGIDVTTIASGAIDRAQTGGTAAKPIAPAGPEPVRHQVVRGETAYTIARLYNVNVKSLAEWNGLGPDLAVREGQYLLIPVASAAGPAPIPATDIATAPGQGSPTPTPPSASKPLPAENPKPASQPVATPAAPDLGSQTTAASATQMALPADGKIIRGYKKGKNEGIDIEAPAGAAVKAAADGTVASITKDTEQVQILVLRHAGGLLTVYAGIDNVAVQKGAAVKRGQPIAKVRGGSSPFLHFEVRKGFDSVDPMPYLK